MPAPIVLSSVFPSWVLLKACLAAGAAAVMVVTAAVALPTQPRQRARQPQHTAPDRALSSLRATPRAPVKLQWAGHRRPGR